jgi:hypothetical protein
VEGVFSAWLPHTGKATGSCAGLASRVLQPVGGTSPAPRTALRPARKAARHPGSCRATLLRHTTFSLPTLPPPVPRASRAERAHRGSPVTLQPVVLPEVEHRICTDGIERPGCAPVALRAREVPQPPLAYLRRLEHRPVPAPPNPNPRTLAASSRGAAQPRPGPTRLTTTRRPRTTLPTAPRVQPCEQRPGGAPHRSSSTRTPGERRGSTICARRS